MQQWIALITLLFGCFQAPEPVKPATIQPSLETTQRRTIIKRLSPGCKAGDGDACNDLADLYATAGWGGGKMVTIARSLYNRACGYGNPEGCYQIGAWSQGCDLGHAQSCDFVDCFSKTNWDGLSTTMDGGGGGN